jgi:hypothetical protein
MALLPFVAPGSLFLEPCAGDGALIALLEAEGLDCYGRFDLGIIYIVTDHFAFGQFEAQ